MINSLIIIQLLLKQPKHCASVAHPWAEIKVKVHVEHISSAKRVDAIESKLTRPGLLQPGTSRSAHPYALNQSRTRLFDQSLFLRAQTEVIPDILGHRCVFKCAYHSRCCGLYAHGHARCKCGWHVKRMKKHWHCRLCCSLLVPPSLLSLCRVVGDPEWAGVAVHQFEAFPDEAAQPPAGKQNMTKNEATGKSKVFNECLVVCALSSSSIHKMDQSTSVSSSTYWTSSRNSTTP